MGAPAPPDRDSPSQTEISATSSRTSLTNPAQCVLRAETTIFDPLTSGVQRDQTLASRGTSRHPPHHPPGVPRHPVVQDRLKRSRHQWRARTRIHLYPHRPLTGPHRNTSLKGIRVRYIVPERTRAETPSGLPTLRPTELPAPLGRQLRERLPQACSPHPSAAKTTVFVPPDHKAQPRPITRHSGIEQVSCARLGSRKPHWP